MATDAGYLNAGLNSATLQDQTFFWNAAALSLFAQAILAGLLASYLATWVVRDWRRGQRNLPTLLLVALLIAVFAAFVTSLVRALYGGGSLSYAMPWSPPGDWTTLAMPWARPFGGIACASLLLLAYVFPSPLRGARTETRLVASALALLLLVEIGFAIGSDIAIANAHAWWRPDWLAAWMVVATFWTTITFWRQLRAAQPESGKPTTAHDALALIWRRLPNREASVARAFLLLSLLPLLHSIGLLVVGYLPAGQYPVDILIVWIGIIQLLGLTLVFVGYLPERSSFLFKLTTIGVAGTLVAITGVAWMMSPVLERQFRPPDMVASGQSLLLFPRQEAEYVIQPNVFLTDPVRGRAIGEEGTRIELGFAFPFYGRSYDRVFIDRLGTIGFDRIPRPTDAAFGTGVQPAIYPLLVETPPGGSRVIALAGNDRLIVTRRDRCDPGIIDQCYAVQTVLYSDGRIELRYLDVPRTPQFALFEPLRAPWLAGVTPGKHAATGEPVLLDFYRSFLAYLDRMFAPLVGFTFATAIVATVILPVILGKFLVEPLQQLLRGIRRFRDGEFDMQVPIKFNDEIGYLIESFNAMATERQAMLRDLEERVATKVAEIADMTIESAQLEERLRLSADLHDAVAQTLASASLHANALPVHLEAGGAGNVEAADRIARLNRHALDEMRLLIRELRRDGPDDGPVGNQLTELVETFAHLHGLKIASEISDETALPPDVRAVFYRVAQESLNNIVKHSASSMVEFTFDAIDDRALLVVRDNGRGFDPAKREGREHLGLSIMRDRARMIGATLQIESSPGEGCRITMIWSRPE